MKTAVVIAHTTALACAATLGESPPPSSSGAHAADIPLPPPAPPPAGSVSFEFPGIVGPNGAVYTELDNPEMRSLAGLVNVTNDEGSVPQQIVSTVGPPDSVTFYNGDLQFLTTGGTCVANGDGTIPDRCGSVTEKLVAWGDNTSSINAPNTADVVARGLRVGHTALTVNINALLPKGSSANNGSGAWKYSEEVACS